MSESTPHELHLKHGIPMLEAIDGDARLNVMDALKDIAPELGHHVIAWDFEGIYARTALEPHNRQLVSLGMLRVRGAYCGGSGRSWAESWCPARSELVTSPHRRMATSLATCPTAARRARTLAAPR